MRSTLFPHVYCRSRGGPTIIISPLLSLMRNQVEAAAKYSVRLAAANSSNSPQENQDAEKRFLADELDALIISPERLANPEFYESVLQPAAERIGLFVIDEAHCISDWGRFSPGLQENKKCNCSSAAECAGGSHDCHSKPQGDGGYCSAAGRKAQRLRGPLSRESLTLQNIPS